MENNHNNVDNKNNDLDLIEVVGLLWTKRSFIIKLTSLFIIFGLLVSFGIKKEYKTSVKILPELSEGQGGASSLLKQFGGLSNLAGIDISGFSSLGMDDALNPKLYPDIIKSTPFLLNLLQQELLIPSLDTTVTLYIYLTELQKPSVIEYLGKYTIGLPGTLLTYYREKSDKEVNSSLQNDTPLDLTLKQNLTLKDLKERVTSFVETNNGIIQISSEFPDKHVSAFIADATLNNLKEYVTSYRLDKLLKTLEFIQELHNTAKVNFISAQKELATFQDINKNVILASVKSEEDRLNANYNLTFNIYTSLSQQLEQAKIKIQEKKPLFKVLEPPQVPYKKSKPRRMLILIAMTFLGGITSMVLIIRKDYFPSRNISSTHEKQD